MNAKAILTASIVALYCAISGPAAPADAWKVETVDNTGVGQFSSLKIDKDGNAHVAYIIETDHALRYAFWDRSLRRWLSMTVGTNASFCSLALDSKQHPHISFADNGTFKGAMLRHVYWDGTSWKTQPIPIASVEVVAYYTSIAIDPHDNPIISYYNYGGVGGDFVLTLRTAAWTGSYWEVRTADPQYGSGKFNAIAVDQAGNPHIAYSNVSAMTAALRYAYWNGESWRQETLAGGYPAIYFFSVALALDNAGNPHITATTANDHLITYATRRGGKWELETLDSIRKVAYPDRNGITLDAQGTPYISYYDGLSGVLKLAHKVGPKRWAIEEVDGDGAGFQSSAQIADGSIWITYADEQGGRLKCARRRLDDAPVPASAANSTNSGAK